MPILAKPVLLMLTVLCFCLAGCSPQEEATTQPPQLAAEKKLPQVIVPADVAGRWKAVKVAVRDKESNLRQIYTVEIGQDFMVADSPLNLKVESFLPNFQMEGLVLTSVSNEPKNPAAQIIIRENGQVVFTGWLFSMYPNTHAFQHPRFSFSLVDFVPAG